MSTPTHPGPSGSDGSSPFVRFYLCPSYLVWKCGTRKDPSFRFVVCICLMVLEKLNIWNLASLVLVSKFSRISLVLLTLSDVERIRKNISQFISNNYVWISQFFSKLLSWCLIWCNFCFCSASGRNPYRPRSGVRHWIPTVRGGSPRWREGTSGPCATWRLRDRWRRNPHSSQHWTADSHWKIRTNLLPTPERLPILG